MFHDKAGYIYRRYFFVGENTMNRVLHLFEWIGYLRRLMADGMSAIFIGIDCVRKGRTARGLLRVISLLLEIYFIPLLRTEL